MTSSTDARPALDQRHWQQRLDELAAKHDVPGASLAVLRLGADGDELVEAATGVLNRSTGAQVTPDSVFQIGSITKVWTASVAISQPLRASNSATAGKLPSAARAVVSSRNSDPIRKASTPPAASARAAQCSAIRRHVHSSAPV